jgi:hypothetical protein
MNDMSERELLSAILTAVQTIDAKVTAIDDRLMATQRQVSVIDDRSITTQRDIKHIKRQLARLTEDVYDTIDRVDELEKEQNEH